MSAPSDSTLSAEEREAMERARYWHEQPRSFENGWLAAKEFYQGQGATSRSRERMLAATSGVCSICGHDVPERQKKGWET